MSSAYEIQIMSLQKLAHTIGAKGVGDASVILAPGLHLLVRVCPQQIAQQPCVWDVCRPRDAFDLLQGFELRREPAVHAQDLHIPLSIFSLCSDSRRSFLESIGRMIFARLQQPQMLPCRPAVQPFGLPIVNARRAGHMVLSP